MIVRKVKARVKGLEDSESAPKSSLVKRDKHLLYRWWEGEKGAMKIPNPLVIPRLHIGITLFQVNMFISELFQTKAEL